MNDLMVL